MARCDGCGRPLCLACATPVRGGALGAECLQAAIGPDAPVPERTSVGTPPARIVVRAAFALAVVATVLPWSRFGAGSGAFGGWSRSPRWSIPVAVAATVGLLVAVGRPRLPGGRVWDAVLVAAGAVLTAGSALSLLAPPDFASPWIGPWVAFFAGLAALAASLAARGTRNGLGVHV